jgi:hypothetical protein
MCKIFEEGIGKGFFLDKPPIILADIVLAMFSGIVLWEESKRLIDSQKDFLKSTLEIAFEIFSRGIRTYPNSIDSVQTLKDFVYND